MSYRTASSDGYNMTNNGLYPSYTYAVDPNAAYYQQSISMNNGSVSPEATSFATSYANPNSVPRAMTGAIRTRCSPDVGMDDPTQARRYTTVSRTSRKVVPAYFSTRQPRQRQTSIPTDEEDELTEEPPAANATDQEKIDYKRRQNTLAARRSRKKKQQLTQNLAETVDRLKMEKEIWKTRALTLKQLLHSHGVPCPDFPDS